MKISLIIVVPFLLTTLTNCGRDLTSKDYLVSFNDTITNRYGYKDTYGVVVIPPGKYQMCFTDTFRSYAVVALVKDGIVAINRQENVMYEVFMFDNGPDEPSDGLFRIIAKHKIGYADATTGKVVITPQFECAKPFENGLAEVSYDCKLHPDGEHSSWQSSSWFYIDKTGKRTEATPTSLQ